MGTRYGNSDTRTTLAAHLVAPRAGAQTLVGAIAFAVVEVVPFAVLLDFHAPAKFVAGHRVVGEIGVRLVGAFDVFRLDDVTLRVQHSVCSHARSVPPASRTQ